MRGAELRPTALRRLLDARDREQRESEIASCAGCGAPARRRLDGTWWLSRKCRCTDDERSAE